MSESDVADLPSAYYRERNVNAGYDATVVVNPASSSFDFPATTTDRDFELK